MITSQVAPIPGIKAGKFGRSGKMVIKSYEVPVSEKGKYIKVLLRLIKIIPGGCWEWQGRIHNKYGCFPEPGGSTKWAHRVSYAIFNGRIKKQMHIDHTCRNPKCCNPKHLKQVTPTENYLAIRRRKLREEKRLQEKAGQLTLWG